MARIVAILCRSRDDPAAANRATPLLTLRWTFPAKRASVVVTDSKPDGLLLSPRQRPVGLRGVWVVAARCCADALERSFACPSAKVREPVRRGLHPESVRRRAAVGSPAISNRERILNRHGCLHCCADRTSQPLLLSCAPPVGSRTRCVDFLPPWCERSSGFGWNPRRQTASASIGLLPARLPPMPRVCRVRSHAAAPDRPSGDRGRDRGLRPWSEHCPPGPRKGIKRRTAGWRVSP